MSKMEQIRTTFGRFSDEYDRNLTDLSLLTEFSCTCSYTLELLDSLESSLEQYRLVSCSYLSSSSNRMECSIRRVTVALNLTAVKQSVMENWTSRMLLCFPAAAAALLQCCWAR